MYSSQPSELSQYHTQGNALPSQQELNNWTNVSYKRGKTAQYKTERETKHTKESEHWLTLSNLHS
jgi:hypothetical protein